MNIVIQNGRVIDPKNGVDRNSPLFIADGKVVVDGNHPLAGVSLIFDVTIASVRAASAEVISHGHVHGQGGHHH